MTGIWKSEQFIVEGSVGNATSLDVTIRYIQALKGLSTQQ